MNVTRRASRSARVGFAGLATIALVALFAPWLAPNRPGEIFRDRTYAPPMRVHMRDGSGFHAPFVYRQILTDRTMKTYEIDAGTRMPLSWASNGHVVSIAPQAGPLLLLGADPLGRDVFSRLIYGAGLSLGVTLVGAATALALGALFGGLAGANGGRIETLIMLIADFVLLLPGVYLVLVLRSVLPQVLTTTQVFWLMAALFGTAGWPHVARGVRAIVAAERARDYAEAARAAGAGRLRLLRHLLPAAHGFLAVELALLVPALLVAEATLSFLNLGFLEPTPSWGTMLREAENVTALRQAPWTLAPAIALFVVVLCIQLVGGSSATARAALGSDPA